MASILRWLMLPVDVLYNWAYHFNSYIFSIMTLISSFIGLLLCIYSIYSKYAIDGIVERIDDLPNGDRILTIRYEISKTIHRHYVKADGLRPQSVGDIFPLNYRTAKWLQQKNQANIHNDVWGLVILLSLGFCIFLFLVSLIAFVVTIIRRRKMKAINGCHK